MVKVTHLSKINEYCCSFYSSPLQSLDGNEYSTISIASGKALKVIWSLPYAIHKRILSLLCGSATLHVQLKAIFVKFIHLALNHNNSIINSVTKYACNNPMYVCGRNWSEFVYVNGVVTESVKAIYNEWYRSVNVTEMDTVSVLNDMIDVRDCSILNTEYVNFIINDICTN